VVNPVGMTTYWYYFSWIIVYNLVTIYQIWYQDAPLSRFSVHQISRQSDNAFVQFPHLDKKKRKEEIWTNSANFWRFISRKCLAQFKFEIWGDDVGRHFYCKNHLDLLKYPRNHVYMKIALLLFLLITHGCGTLASWATHDTVSYLNLYKYLSHLPKINIWLIIHVISK